MQYGRVRERACFGKGHGCSDLLGHLMLKLFEVCIGSEIVIAHCPLEQDQGITRTMFLDFIFGAVMTVRWIGHGMPHEPVSQRFNEERSLSGTGRASPSVPSGFSWPAHPYRRLVLPQCRKIGRSP